MLRLSLLAILIGPVALQGATILSENFDELPAQLGVTTTVGEFTVAAGNVDVVGPGNGFGWLCAGPESGNCIDLNGNTAGTIESAPITLQAGTDYFLSFDLIGTQRGDTISTTVSLGNYTQTFVLTSSDVTTAIEINHLITVSTTTVTNLIFRSNDPGVDGDLLDDVLLTSVAAVPEPRSAALFAAGLLVAVLARRRHRLSGN